MQGKAFHYGNWDMTMEYFQYRRAGNFRGGLIFADFVGGLQNTNIKPKNQWA